MAVCCCSLAGTAACQHCRNNPMATDVWSNKTVMIDHVEVKPFGNGIDVCPVCGKPSTIGKPVTRGDRIRSMSDEELAKWRSSGQCPVDHYHGDYDCMNRSCEDCWLDWLKEEAE